MRLTYFAILNDFRPHNTHPGAFGGMMGNV
jgi:hypothetical protein